MKLTLSPRFGIAALFRRTRINAEVDDEQRSHIQLRADDLERSGVPRPEAERRARIDRPSGRGGKLAFGSEHGHRQDLQSGRAPIAPSFTLGRVR